MFKVSGSLQVTGYIYTAPGEPDSARARIMKVFLYYALLAAAAVAAVSADCQPGGSKEQVLAQKQYDVNYLVYKLYGEIRDDTLKVIGQIFNPQGDLTSYHDNGDSVNTLMTEFKDGRLLQKKHWFSLFNTRQREEALMMHKVLINSKNWNVFACNAAYFRTNMNEGEFLYALYVSLIHSELGEGVVLPPLYEVTPHMFTNSEVIHEAYKAQMTSTPSRFESHFTGSRKNPEQHVAYFGEDVGMNTHHVLWHMEFPFWWEDSSEDRHLDRKGESFFWVHHQLTVRYDAERLSNYLEPVEELSWKKPIEDGFAPHTAYKYGGYFPSRPDHVDFADVEGVARVRDMLITDDRIREAIAHGYIDAKDGSHIDIMNSHGIEFLGDIIESSGYSANTGFYGSLHNTAHIMLSRQGDPTGKFDLPPGVLEHFETSTRDPSFFRLHKYMDNIFRKHKDSLTPYTKDQLEFTGLSIDSIGIQGKLETFFENFKYSLLNAVDDTVDIADVEIETYIQRLNHKNFSFLIDVTNTLDTEVLATVRIFAWPLRDNNGIVYSFNEGRWRALELDRFWVKVKKGHQQITRHSTESSVTVPDVPSLHTLMERADATLSSDCALHLEEYESAMGLPNRFLLPKGQEQGMEFNLVVAVTDGRVDAALDNLHENTKFIHYGHDRHYPDKQPHGYPLDRRVDDERIFEALPNFKQMTVKLYSHEEVH
ncbi:hemocyanin subunit-like [Panulirus ornatus]|uniref:hemocyanin subunit-like n=1 Tax=Panulirus ornatus TaxID=150431 RepID=UPI003A84F1C6